VRFNHRLCNAKSPDLLLWKEDPNKLTEGDFVMLAAQTSGSFFLSQGEEDIWNSTLIL
jgi:hypothetical protein